MTSASGFQDGVLMCVDVLLYYSEFEIVCTLMYSIFILFHTQAVPFMVVAWSDGTAVTHRLSSYVAVFKCGNVNPSSHHCTIRCLIRFINL